MKGTHLSGCKKRYSFDVVSSHLWYEAGRLGILLYKLRPAETASSAAATDSGTNCSAAAAASAVWCHQQASDCGVAAHARERDAQVLPGPAAGVGGAESTVSGLTAGCSTRVAAASSVLTDIALR